MADRPDVIVLQWWTAATLHTYLMVARAAAKAGIPLVLEFHEVQDTGEASVPFVAAYCRRFLTHLLRRASGAIFHNQHDADVFTALFGQEALGRLNTVIAPHGPYDHVTKPKVPEALRASEPAAVTTAVDGTKPTRILSFGLIRPYKGIEDLIQSFDAMTPEQAAQFEIDVVGETWEGGPRLPSRSSRVVTAIASVSRIATSPTRKPPSTSTMRTSSSCPTVAVRQAAHFRSP